MSEFEIGQQVAVSDVSIERALENFKNEATKYYYLFTQADDQVVVRAVKPDGSDYVSLFAYVAEIPEGENKMNTKEASRAADMLVDLAELLSTKEAEITPYELLENITNRSINRGTALLIEVSLY